MGLIIIKTNGLSYSRTINGVFMPITKVLKQSIIASFIALKKPPNATNNSILCFIIKGAKGRHNLINEQWALK